MNHVVTNLGHSARERLKNLSRESGRIPDYLFQRYAYERSFYRLGESRYRSRFVLKGASLFSICFRVTTIRQYTGAPLAPGGELSRVPRASIIGVFNPFHCRSNSE